MNLKPNLWTLLFILAMGALIYLTSKEDRPSHTPPIQVDLSDTIPRDSAFDQMIRYSIKFRSVVGTDAFKDSVNIVNPDVFYYKLEKDELSQIISLHQGKNVYAIPVLQYITQDSQVVDLLFSDVEPDSTKTFLDGLFFDFSKPCPNLCNE